MNSLFVLLNGLRALLRRVQGTGVVGCEVMVIRQGAQLKGENGETSHIEFGTRFIIQDVEGIWLRVAGGCVAHFDVMRLDDAERHFTMMVQGEPTADNFRNRALIYRALGKTLSALADMNQVVRLEGNAKNLFFRALLWNEQGNWERALQDYDEVLKLDPTLSAAYYNRSFIWREQESFERAIEECCASLRLNPNHANAHFVIGTCLQAQQKYEQAIEAYSEAIQLAPKFVGAYRRRAQCWSELNEDELAIQGFSAVLGLDPQDHLSYCFRAIAWRKRGNFERAIEDLSNAIRLVPNEPRYYYERGHTWHVSGHQAEALANFREAMQLDADDLSTLNDMAWLLACASESALRNGERAVELATKVCELSEWKEPGLIDTLAAAHAEAGDFDAALKYQQMAIEMSPSDDAHLSEYHARVELFRNKQAYREPAQQ